MRALSLFSIPLLLNLVATGSALAQQTPPKVVKCPTCQNPSDKEAMIKACQNVAKFASAYGYKIDYESSECSQISDPIVIKDNSYWYMMVANPPRLFVTRPTVLSTGDCYYYPKPEARRQIRDYECLN